MTEDEFREKWAHLGDDETRFAEIVSVAVDLIVETVQSIEFLTVAEIGPEKGLDDEEVEFVHDFVTDRRLGEFIREALT